MAPTRAGASWPWPARPGTAEHTANADRRRSARLLGRTAGGKARAARRDLHDVAVGIAHVDRAEGAAVEHLRAFDAAAAQVVAPRLLLLGRLDHEREVMRGAHADDARGQLGVLHERDQHPGTPVLRAEPDVP